MAGYRSYLKDHGSEITFTSEFNNRKNSFIETKIAYGDANFFSFFNIPLVEGSEENILKLAGSVALSEKTATKSVDPFMPLAKYFYSMIKLHFVFQEYLKTFNAIPTWIWTRSFQAKD